MNLVGMIKMEIESENDTTLCQQMSPYLMQYHCNPYMLVNNPFPPVKAKDTASHSLSLEEMRSLKKKQEKNILNKIEKIVQKVTPIHQADYESENENDMHDLIEEFEKMDIELKDKRNNLLFRLLIEPSNQVSYSLNRRYKFIVKNKNLIESDDDSVILIVYNNLRMKKAKKVIQNYQIVDTLEQFENQYQILLAKHTTDKKFYVLKKLSIKEGNNQALYEGLLNEAKLLKMLNHENIVKCYRMLKTSNNIYLAYSYLEGSPLDEILEGGPKSLTFIQKENIAKQLCLVLLQLQKNGIAHLNITPENIILGDGVIMIREFLYAMEIPEEGQTEVIRKVPKSAFVAPETRRGIACLEADIYSAGKVLEKLDFSRSKNDPNNSVDYSKRIEDLLGMIEGMVTKDRAQRMTLNQIYQWMFPNKKKVKRLKSLSESGLQTSRISRANSLSSSKSQFGGKQIYGEILMKILRHRNMSWLLMRLFKRVIDIRLSHEITVILGMLLLKKSTKLLANLGKYLHYGKNDIGIDINARDQTRFFKTTDYHKVCDLMDKEIGCQKKQLEVAIQTIYVNNSALLKKPEFSREFKEEQTNQKFLDKCLREYLNEVLKSNDLSDEAVFDLYLMSLLVYYQGIEGFFQQRILFEPSNFDDQFFVKKAREMTKEKLIENIQQNLQPKIIEI